MRIKPTTAASALVCCLLAVACDSAETDLDLELELQTRDGQTAILSTTRSGPVEIRPVFGLAPCPPPQTMTTDPQTWPIDLWNWWLQILPEMENEWQQSVAQVEGEFEQICWELCDDYQLEFSGDYQISSRIEPQEVPYGEDECGKSTEPVEVDREIYVELGSNVDCTCDVLQ